MANQPWLTQTIHVSYVPKLVPFTANIEIKTENASYGAKSCEL